MKKHIATSASVVVLCAIAVVFGFRGGPSPVDRGPDEYEVPWYSIANGGAMWINGGDFTLGGTIGQPEANVTLLTGGDFSIVGGFWVVPQPTRADSDGDGDTDLADYSQFQGCCSGPTQAPEETCPSGADTDQDNDIDLDDFWTLQNCFNGPDQPPACE